MSLILQIKEANEKLIAENNALRAENTEIKAGIQQIVNSLNVVFTSTGLNADKLKGKSNASLAVTVLSKLTSKKTITLLEGEWERLKPIITKHKNLISE